MFFISWNLFSILISLLTSISSTDSCVSGYVMLCYIMLKFTFTVMFAFAVLFTSAITILHVIRHIHITLKLP